MDALKNCKICGRVFQSNGFRECCNMCEEQDEKEFERIREYLQLHPLAKIFEVSYALDITLGKIKKYLQEGRMEIVERDNQFLKCESCGKSICSGTYCESCVKPSAHDYRSYYVGTAGSNEKSGIRYKKNPYLIKSRPTA